MFVASPIFSCFRPTKWPVVGCERTTGQSLACRLTRCVREVPHLCQRSRHCVSQAVCSSYVWRTVSSNRSRVQVTLSRETLTGPGSEGREWVVTGLDGDVGTASSHPGDVYRSRATDDESIDDGWLTGRCSRDPFSADVLERGVSKRVVRGRPFQRSRHTQQLLAVSGDSRGRLRFVGGQ